MKCSFSFDPFCKQFLTVASQDYVTKLLRAQSHSVTLYVRGIWFIHLKFFSASVLLTIYSQECKQYHWTGIILMQVDEDNNIKYFGNSLCYWMQYKKAWDTVKPIIVCRLWEKDISRQWECKCLNFNDETMSTAELACLRHNELCP
jgi:hypothetical protein